MRTAALLPTPGDPFQFLYWLRNFRRVWGDEVDQLYVHVNAQPDLAARELIREAVDAVAGVYLEWDGGGRMSHGDALNILIQECDADLVMLCEDDALVRQPGVVARNFGFLEGGHADVIASPRVSMTPELEQAALTRWGPVVTVDGGSGHGMWPAFVFSWREALLATDRHFGERAWSPGRAVAGLRYTIRGPEQQVADTFGATAFQLRDRFTVRDLAQWKGPWAWERWLAEGPMPWFHIGSLSSSGNLASAGCELMENRMLVDDMEIGEWAHRVHWWDRFVAHAGDALPAHQARYRANLGRLVVAMGIPPARVVAWAEVVDRMVTWDETP